VLFQSSVFTSYSVYHITDIFIVTTNAHPPSEAPSEYKYRFYCLFVFIRFPLGHFFLLPPLYDDVSVMSFNGRVKYDSWMKLRQPTTNNNSNNQRSNKKLWWDTQWMDVSNSIHSYIIYIYIYIFPLRADPDVSWKKLLHILWIKKNTIEN
jgi:hypothetical protein